MASWTSSYEDAENCSTDTNVYFSKPANIHLIEADIAECMPQAFTDLWRSQQRCDITLTCKDEEFKVHSLVLYAYSPHLANLIEKSTEKDKVTLDFDTDLVKLCLEFVYCGRIEVTTEQLEMLTEMADLLDIKHLYRKCKATRFKDCTKENCLEALCFWESTGEEDMKISCLQLALTVFEEISDTRGFMNLCSKCVTGLVSHENLVVSSPGDRLSAAIAWLEYDRERRAVQTVPLLQKLPLHEMTRTEIRYAMRSPMVQNNKQAASIINAALDQQRKVRKSSIEFEVREVSDDPKAEFLVSMARLDATGNTIGKDILVTPLSFIGKTCKITDLPADPPQHNTSVGCVAHGSSLYVTGLGKNNKEAWVFTIGNGRWKQLCDLQNSRVSHCMAQYDGDFYVLGGQSVDIATNKATQKPVHPVEVLRPGSSEWQHAGHLEGKRCFNSCCVVIDDGILVHGSYDEDTSLLQLYKPKQKVTELFVKYLREEFVEVQGIVKTGNHIILCGSDHINVCTLSSTNKSRQVVQQTVYDLPRIAPTVHLSENGQFIYAVGGKDRYNDQRYEDYIQRASVKDVINNTGSGWQGVKMNWPTSQQVLYPGAHCTAMFKLKDLVPL